MKKKTWMCVSYRRGGVDDGPGWCALAPGKKPDPDVWNDETLCGFVVVGRTGERRRQPTCPCCRRLLGLKPLK